MSGGHVKLESLTKRFDDVAAVDGISVEILAGEFFSLLGPSGCGKTTTLRMIAGFEPPTSGKILLDGVDVANRPANQRNVNTVFQSYALFPFLTVAENVAFGMKYKSVPKSERDSRVAQALALVQLSGYEKRRPNQLSGGQQQRVALARALVLRPAVLLLDEPLGALDARIRKQLRVELKALQEEVGITFVFVTHDQEEALSMSDRVAVMNNGRIEQLGTPAEVYEDPATVFAADFLGVSNLMDAEAVGGAADHCMVRVGQVTLRATCGSLAARGAVKIVARPERIDLLAHGEQSDNCVPALVERTIYVGATRQVILRLASGETIQASVTNTGGSEGFEHGTPVAARIPPDALRVLAGEAAASPTADAGDELSAVGSQADTKTA